MTWQTYLKQNEERFLSELFDFIRIPSISALPAHADDVVRAADWVAQRLTAAGAEHAEVLPTGGHPVVYGDWLHAPGRPTVLIYGHFDVQPVDPIELWHSPPFEPRVENGRIYARGASDDKGGMLTPILAVEALLQSEGKLPLNVKFIFEGQEEIGSPQLPAFMAANRDRFACDLVVSADGLQWTADEPSLVVGLKGLAALQIDVQTANGDLHSGLHGGAVPNPIHALVRILDSLRSPEGKIMVDGFYDDVVALNEAEREQLTAVPFDETAYKASLGLDDLFGEPGYTTRERNWTRPTLEINGIWGGFQGEGTKTVIPNQAHAKITCRLVANQDPATIIRQISDHVARHTPPGAKVTITPRSGSSTPYLMPTDHPGNVAAAAVLEELYGQAPYVTRLGGSIPVCSLFLKELAAYTVGFGFSIDDENLHAPNEFVRIRNFERGQRGYCMLLKELAETLEKSV